VNERLRDARRSQPACRAFAWRAVGAAIGLSAAAVLSGCATGAGASRPSANGASSAFTLGADISALATPGRRRPLPAYQENGVASDELSILRRHGWSSFRLRVFVSPVRNAPDNSLERMIPLAKQIKASGGLFLLDIHYSDTWADPGHQETPVAWRSLDFAGLERQVETYSRSTIEAFKAAGAMPDWVQVGNEITRGMLWPMAQLRVPGATQTDLPTTYDDSTQWDHLTRLLKAGIRGVKAGAGDTPPRIAIHIDKGGDWETSKWFFDHIEAARVPYDIIAQSFYPPWRHGTLEGLWQNMTESARRYDKDFAVVETGYGRSQTPDNPFMLWPTTPEGRLQFMVDVVNTVKKAPRGISVMYWAPEFDLWNSDGTPGPAVSTLEHLDLTARPASHAPREVHP
jgi:arabinogalactan endo-1,4-beta-galactosidase